MVRANGSAPLFPPYQSGFLLLEEARLWGAWRESHPPKAA